MEIDCSDFLRNNKCAVVGNLDGGFYQSLLNWWYEEDDHEEGKPTLPHEQDCYEIDTILIAVMFICP